MRSSLVALAALGLVLAPCAVAQAADARIATRSYDAGTIVSLEGRVGIQSMVAFGTGEKIENIAVGDSAAWQITPNRRADVLFVRPLSATARTNMTVITNLRTYLFDLVALPRGAPIYLLRFRYPDDGVARATVAAGNRSAPAGPTVDPTQLNFAWDTRGDRALLPSQRFDDGQRLYLAWSKDTMPPAILARALNGDMGPINYTVEGEYVAIDGRPAQIWLRRGRETATLTRRQPWSPVAAPPSSPATVVDIAGQPRIGP